MPAARNSFIVSLTVRTQEHKHSGRTRGAKGADLAGSVRKDSLRYLGGIAMTDGIEKRLIRPAEIVGGTLATIAVLLSAWFAGVIVVRTADALIGWGYEFQSIADFLSVQESHNKVLGWDRSFLLLGAAMAGFTLAGLLNEFVEWARKSPELRRADQECVRQVLTAQQQTERLQNKEARKAARKTMSGWRRLWIVSSVVFGVLAFLIAHENNSRASSYVSWNGNDEAFWSAAYADPALAGCDWRTAEAKYPIAGSYSVSCETRDPFTPALPWAFLPAMFMAVVGLTLRWIYRGFRPRAPSDRPGAL